MIYGAIDAFITDYYLTFDYEGFVITERNRISQKMQIKSYKWNQIKEVYFIKLAQYYSGREGIVKLKRKRKLYEKEW